MPELDDGSYPMPEVVTLGASTIHTFARLAVPDQFALFVTAADDRKLVVSRLEIDGSRVVVQAWPDDAGWADFMTTQVRPRRETRPPPPPPQQQKKKKKKKKKKPPLRKSAELCRLLVKAGATVQVVMTEAATQFITPVTMQALSGRPVYTSQWDAREPNNMPHINLSREADAIVLAPCQRRLHCPAGAGPLRRTAEPAVPGAPDRPRAAADRAGHEPRDVGPSGHAAQPAPGRRRRRPRAGRGQRLAGLRRDRRRPHARSRAAARRHRGAVPAQGAGRPARGRHGRPDLRGARSDPRHHQPFVRQDGLRHRARGARSRRRGHAGGRPGAPAHAARRAPHRRAVGAARCSTRPLAAAQDADSLRRDGGRGRLAAGHRTASTRSRRTAAASRRCSTSSRTTTSC